MSNTKASQQHGTESAANVMVIDDEPNMCAILAKILRSEGYSVSTHTDPEEGLKAARDSQPDIILTDYQMPGVNGQQILEAIHREQPQTQVLIMTAYGTIEGAKDALREGALDYVTKPFKTDELLLTLQKALEHKKVVDENVSLSEVIKRTAPEETLIGQSSEIAEIRSMIGRIAPTGSAVLIRGESGTGKEIVARSIHTLSGREGRFVPINCASIPESLMESELFGYEKGAFTGADARKLGLMELASGGTLFLDEVAELPLSLQVKLLRVLQEREIQRVGGLKNIPVDIRLVTATNRNLKRATEDGDFRADLYFRLNVINLRIPPLRDRTDDIPLLARHFLARFGQKLNRPNLELTSGAVRALQKYPWPGNVRELENVIERMVVLSDNQILDVDDVPPDIRGQGTPPMGMPTMPDAPIDSSQKFREARSQFEKQYIEQILDRAGGNVAEAARLSGISRRNLYEKIDRLDIDTGAFKKPDPNND